MLEIIKFHFFDFAKRIFKQRKIWLRWPTACENKIWISPAKQWKTLTLIRSLQIIIVDPLFRFLCSISIMKLKNDPHFHIYVVSSILYCRETKKVTKIWQTFSFFTITVDHFQTIVSFVLICGFIDQKITSIAIETLELSHRNEFV